MEVTKPSLTFENLWQKEGTPIHASVKKLWKKHFPDLSEERMNTRLQQVVFVLLTEGGEVVGVSTSYKAYIQHLKNRLYAYRCFIDPAYRMPGLASKLL